MLAPLLHHQTTGLASAARSAARPSQRGQRGFTLIELLVAVAVMALLSFMAWRGLEGMSRTERLTSQRADDLLALQAGLGQWAADLQALHETGEVAALDFNGQTLRLTRRDPLANAVSNTAAGAGTPATSPGLQVVAWAVHQGQWQRWHTADITTREALNLAWLQAERWGQRPVADDALRQVSVARADGWQLFYYRGDAWTNPLSSDAAAASAASASAASGAAGQALAAARQLARLPDGVRLVLTLSPGQTLGGELVRDWARPTLGGGKS